MPEMEKKYLLALTEMEIVVLSSIVGIGTFDLAEQKVYSETALMHATCITHVDTFHSVADKVTTLLQEAVKDAQNVRV